VNGITKGWAQRWRANQWRRNDKEFAENPDLWRELLQLCEKHAVRFQWVRGHSGHAENECCDRLAATAARVPDLPVDSAFESTRPR
jgi:ribonuclease HI